VRSAVAHRGNALPETALVVSLALLLLLGAVQQAILGFDQIAADGASFMGAEKSVQLRGGSASLADAQAVVAALFPKVTQSDVTIAQSTSGQALFETDVSEQVSTFHVPGMQMPSSITIQSRDVEAAVPSSTPTPGIPALCYQVAGSTSTTPTFNLGLSSVLNSSTGVISTSTITAHYNTLASVSSSLTKITTDVGSVANDLYAIVNLPIVGNTVTLALRTLGLAGNSLSQVQTFVATLVQPGLNASLTGTATSGLLSGLLSSVVSIVSSALSLLYPTTAAAFSGATSTLSTDLSTLNGAEHTLASITGTSGC
jgi:hypothetical protein